MKLNVKRTMLVGLAFLSISAFWGLYDFVVPLILRDTYHLGDTWAGLVMAMDNIVALVLLPLFGALSDRCHSRLGRRTPFILIGTLCAATLTLSLPAVVRRGSLAAFLTVLALLLLSMGFYRSPAVALMPDVTPKPLRSKANAIINLMGALGSAISLGLVNFAVLRTVDEAGVAHSDYTVLFISVAVLMLACIAVLFATVREKKLADEMARCHYGEAPEQEQTAVTHEGGERRLHPDVMRSLVLILCSVSLWFMGYNAVMTAFSKYATRVWNVAEGAAANCVLVGTIGAIISYWPVGLLSSRFGRKRMIQTGILLLTAMYVLAAFLDHMSSAMYVFFALVGVGWAAINVNSFPMVVELASGADTGRYTGYYYTFSMAAQVITPVLSGALLEHVGYRTLFPYAALCVLASFVTMCFVRHGDAKPAARRGLEALDVEE